MKRLILVGIALIVIMGITELVAHAQITEPLPDPLVLAQDLGACVKDQECLNLLETYSGIDFFFPGEVPTVPVIPQETKPVEPQVIEVEKFVEVPITRTEYITVEKPYPVLEYVTVDVPVTRTQVVTVPESYVVTKPITIVQEVPVDRILTVEQEIPVTRTIVLQQQVPVTRLVEIPQEIEVTKIVTVPHEIALSQGGTSVLRSLELNSWTDLWIFFQQYSTILIFLIILSMIIGGAVIAGIWAWRQRRIVVT